jgi:hypothetical protein
MLAVVMFAVMIVFAVMPSTMAAPLFVRLARAMLVTVMAMALVPFVAGTVMTMLVMTLVLVAVVAMPVVVLVSVSSAGCHDTLR